MITWLRSADRWNRRHFHLADDLGQLRDSLIGKADSMVALVEGKLELNKQKHSGQLAPSQVERVDREIAATDAEIDELVYELYAITDVEKRIIEEG